MIIYVVACLVLCFPISGLILYALNKYDDEKVAEAEANINSAKKQGEKS